MSEWTKCPECFEDILTGHDPDCSIKPDVLPRAQSKGLFGWIAQAWRDNFSKYRPVGKW
jgi:hypothetical protein